MAILDLRSVDSPDSGEGAVAAFPARIRRPSLLGHIQIARIDHWVKNVFVLPGVVVALSVDRARIHAWSWAGFASGILAICLIASSNYVLNEILDAPFDLAHPTKKFRPVPSGRVSLFWGYVEWVSLMAAGIGLARAVSLPFTLTLLALWLMGCLYNMPPVRSKDLPYVDVLSEAVNNPLRMLAGWYLTGCLLIPPASLLLSYWMVGCFFMAIKRFAEFREIGDSARSAAYRKSFAFYNEQRLLVSIMFYASAAMLLLGAFTVRYRVELILAFPPIAFVMAQYLALAFKPNSSVQHPELLWRDFAIMVPVVLCVSVMVLALFVDIPALQGLFSPTIPRQGW